MSFENASRFLPSCFLPAIKEISGLGWKDVSNLIESLNLIYKPDVPGTQTLGLSAVSGHNSSARGSQLQDGTSRALMDLNHFRYIKASIAISSPAALSTVHPNGVLSPSFNSSYPNPDQLVSLRADEFERACAMNWLTGFISRSEEWIESYGNQGNEGTVDDDELANEQSAREKVVEHACALLAACSGSSAQGTIIRTFVFHPCLPAYLSSSSPLGLIVNSAISGNDVLIDEPLTLEDEEEPTWDLQEVRIQLKDDAVPAQDQDAVGLQTWGCAPILADLISEDIGRFGLDIGARFSRTLNEIDAESWVQGRLDGIRLGNQDNGAGYYRPTGLKILELGAGTGLLSIFLWRLLDSQLHTLPRTTQNDVRTALDPMTSGASRERTGPQWEVVATDYHPMVLENLKYNIQLNEAHSFPSSSLGQLAQISGTMIRGEPLDWQEPPSLEEGETYDLIFGADIIYENGHAELIRRVVERALKRPSWSSGRDGERRDATNTGGVFWLMYPLRHTHTAESESIERVFGLTKGCINGDNQLNDNMEYTHCDENEPRDDWKLGALEVQELSRKKGIGRVDDEVSYNLLKIGWIRIRK